MPSNTKIRYMYRDGSNYKNGREVVFAGQSTGEQEIRLQKALEDDCNFIAEQVGLPELFHWLTGEFAFNDQDDHCWHEFDELLWTDEEPTDKRTIEELVVAFEQASSGSGWKLFDPAERAAR